MAATRAMLSGPGPQKCGGDINSVDQGESQSAGGSLRIRCRMQKGMGGSNCSTALEGALYSVGKLDN